MIRHLLILSTTLLPAFLAISCHPGNQEKNEENTAFGVKLITLDPGHFHAALVQKSMYPGIDSIVNVYAPAGPELQEQLNFIDQYNTRKDNPTHWVEKVYTGKDFLEKMVTEKKGNVVVLAGNNREKTEYIKQSVDAGMDVLGDKPMAIDTAGFNLLLQAFHDAAEKKLLLYDIMTERSEITNILQKELSHIPEVFGAQQKGTVDSPGVEMQSVHFFYKYVSGKVLKRPAWFFDARQQGDAIVDVGTHLVDLVQWMCFPGISLDYKKDIKVLNAKKWPTPVSLSQFSLITGTNGFPDYLKAYITKDTLLNVNANGMVNYTLKGIHARIGPLWQYQAPAGSGDTFFSLLRGTKANLVIRQGKEEKYQPTLYVEPVAGDTKKYSEALTRSIAELSRQYPGIGTEKTANGWEIIIPDKYKLGHEAHFAQVMERYLQYLKDGKLPDWEVPDMIAKYYTTTQASAMAVVSK